MRFRSVSYFKALDLKAKITLIGALLTPVWFMIAGMQSGNLDGLQSFVLGCAVLASVIAICEFIFRRRQRAKHLASR